jgi:hypothetical protein
MPANSTAARAAQSEHASDSPREISHPPATVALKPPARAPRRKKPNRESRAAHSAGALKNEDAPPPSAASPAELKSAAARPRKKGASRASRPASRQSRAARRRQSGVRKLRLLLKKLRARVHIPEAMRMIGLDELDTARQMKSFAGRLSHGESTRDSGKLLLELLRDFVKYLDGPPATALARAAFATTPTSDIPVQMIYSVPRPERDAVFVSRAVPAASAACVAPTDPAESIAPGETPPESF